MLLNQLQKELFTAIRIGGDLSQVQSVVSTQGLSAVERLSTYQRSSLLKITACLEDDFQVTKSFLGEELFDELSHKYFSKYPADTHFINECGKNFPFFLQQEPLQQQHPFLSDLAKMEWLRVESFFNFFDYRTPHPVSIDYELHRIMVNPSLIKMASSWPIHKIWEDEVAYPIEPSELFIWTTENRKVHCEAWSKENTLVLNTLLSSGTIEEASEKLAQDMGVDELNTIFQEVAPEWVSSGLFEILVSER